MDSLSFSRLLSIWQVELLFYFLFIILVFGRGLNEIKQKTCFTKHGVRDFVLSLLKINQHGVCDSVLP
jgi:hypothetical protein